MRVVKTYTCLRTDVMRVSTRIRACSDFLLPLIHVINVIYRSAWAVSRTKMIEQTPYNVKKSKYFDKIRGKSRWEDHETSEEIITLGSYFSI